MLGTILRPSSISAAVNPFPSKKARLEAIEEPRTCWETVLQRPKPSGTTVQRNYCSVPSTSARAYEEPSNPSGLKSPVALL